MKKKLIMKYVSTIIFTSLFLVLSTCFCYLPSKENLAASLSFLDNFQKIKLQQISEEFALDKAYPISDEEGLNTEAYIFKVENNGNSSSSFEIIFTPGRGDMFIDPSSINYVIGDENGYNSVKTLTEEGIVLTDEIAKNSSKTYYLKFWIQEDFTEDLAGKYFQGTLELKNS